MDPRADELEAEVESEKASDREEGSHRYTKPHDDQHQPDHCEERSADPKPKGVLLNVGFTHGVFVTSPSGIKIEVPKPTTIVVSGINNELVGHVAAVIRDVRRPEPYKGKGIRYAGEQVKTKAGKTAK